MFRSAVVLSFPDGLLATVLRDSEGLEARGLWIGDMAFGALAARAAPGSELSFREGPPCRLSLDGASVRFGDLGTWDPRPELVRTAYSFAAAGLEERRRAVHRLGTILDSEGYSEGIHGDGPFGVRFGTLRGEPGFPYTLVGFGPGTTPAGDDFLAGWILGRFLLDGGRIPPAACALDLSRTTAAGRTLLSGVARGVFPAYLADTATALTEEAGAGDLSGEAGLETSVLRAFRHGASSGRDALKGVWEALKTES